MLNHEFTGAQRRRRKRKFVTDDINVITRDTIKLQLANTSSMNMSPHLAPPTRKRMYLAARDGVDELLSLPGRPLILKKLLRVTIINICQSNILKLLPIFHAPIIKVCSIFFSNICDTIIITVQVNPLKRQLECQFSILLEIKILLSRLRGLLFSAKIGHVKNTINLHLATLLLFLICIVRGCGAEITV